MSLATPSVAKIKDEVFSVKVDPEVRKRYDHSQKIFKLTLDGWKAATNGDIRWSVFREMGREMIFCKDSLRLKPLANTIFSRAMKRMATDDPVDIVRDLEAQIKLLVK